MGLRSCFLKKWKLCMQKLTKERKKPPVVILQQQIFYNIFIQCLWLRIIRRSEQRVQFMNFPSQIFLNDINHGQRAAILKKSYFWLLPSYMVVATNCFYEKVRRAMRTTIVSYLLKLIVLIFWVKFAQKRHFWLKMEKVNITTEFCIFKLVQIPYFSLN